VHAGLAALSRRQGADHHALVARFGHPVRPYGDATQHVRPAGADDRPAAGAVQARGVDMPS
jgi:hypothetical protein